VPADHDQGAAVLRDPKLPIDRSHPWLTFFDALVMLTEGQPWMPALA
jgi:hypothetical protein